MRWLTHAALFLRQPMWLGLGSSAETIYDQKYRQPIATPRALHTLSKTTPRMSWTHVTLETHAHACPCTQAAHQPDRSNWGCTSTSTDVNLAAATTITSLWPSTYHKAEPQHARMLGLHAFNLMYEEHYHIIITSPCNIQHLPSNSGKTT